MTAFAYVAIVGWVFFGIMMFSMPNKRRAMLFVVILGWLFLPVMRTNAVTQDEPLALSMPGLKFTKANAVSYAVLAGGLFWDRRRWLAMRPGLVDVPMAVWCLSALPSSLANDQGWYDGASRALNQVMEWGIPYWAGRIYFQTLEDFQELPQALLAAALVYVPLCWFEMLISPQLHNIIYGYHQHEFLQSIRLGGFRPMVFLPHSLVVSMWMWMASVLAFWLWQCGSVRSIRDVPLVGAVSIQVTFGLLLLTSLLCRSMAAMVFGLTGMAVLALSRRTQSALLLGVLLGLAPVYMAVRGTGSWTGEELVASIGNHIDAERAESLAFRLNNESALAAKAMERPFVGWSGWGRSRVYDPQGRDITVTDGAWIIIFGEAGLLGLGAWCIAMLLPAAKFLKDIPPRLWTDPRIAPLAAIAVVLILNVLNNLLNVDTDPTYLLAMGALTSVLGNLVVQPAQHQDVSSHDDATADLNQAAAVTAS